MATTRHVTRSTITLAEAPEGRPLRVLGVQLPPSIAQRFSALGICANAELQVLRRAPFRGPIHLRLVAGELAIRREQAEHILVEAVSPERTDER